MTTTAGITEIIHLTDLTPLTGAFAADYDLPAARAAYVEAIEAAAQLLVPSLTIHGNGVVYAAYEDREAAGQIDWSEVIEVIDAAAILGAHEVRRLPPSGAVRTMRDLAIRCGAGYVTISGNFVEAHFETPDATSSFRELLTGLQDRLGAAGIVQVQCPTSCDVLVTLAVRDDVLLTLAVRD